MPHYTKWCRQSFPSLEIDRGQNVSVPGNSLTLRRLPLMALASLCQVNIDHLSLQVLKATLFQQSKKK